MDQRLCLKWGSFPGSLLNTFGQLRCSGLLVDITLCCEGRCIKAHRLVLCACSSYFREILQDNPCRHPVVFVTGGSFATLQHLISFIYQGQVMVPQNQLQQLLQMAKQLRVEALIDEGERGPTPLLSPRSSDETELCREQQKQPAGQHTGSDCDRLPASASWHTPSTASSSAVSCRVERTVKRQRSHSPAQARLSGQCDSAADNTASSEKSGVSQCGATAPNDRASPGATVFTAADRQTRRSGDESGAVSPARAYVLVDDNLDSHQHHRQQQQQQHPSPHDNTLPEQTDLHYRDDSREDELLFDPDLTCKTEHCMVPESISSLGAATGATDWTPMSAGASSVGAAQPSQAPRSAACWSFSCDDCARTFRSEASLNNHRSMHRGSTRCPLCGSVYSTISAMRRHVRMTHENIAVVRGGGGASDSNAVAVPIVPAGVGSEIEMFAVVRDQAPKFFAE